jgi:ABC-type antimicrobial peptide transport system permease subunit
MRRTAEIAGTVAFAFGVFIVTTVGALVGLNAECNGAASECPRSTPYRATLVVSPVAVLAILIVGAIVARRARSLQPLLLACGAAIVFDAVTDSALGL